MVQLEIDILDQFLTMVTAQRRTESEISRALRLEYAARSVEELRRTALAAEREFAGELDAAAPSMGESAYNLVHYLAVRRHDVRDLQDELAARCPALTPFTMTTAWSRSRLSP
jgi:hypothetical protein